MRSRGPHRPPKLGACSAPRRQPLTGRRSTRAYTTHRTWRWRDGRWFDEAEMRRVEREHVDPVPGCSSLANLKSVRGNDVMGGRAVVTAPPLGEPGCHAVDVYHCFG